MSLEIRDFQKFINDYWFASPAVFAKRFAYIFAVFLVASVAGDWLIAKFGTDAELEIIIIIMTLALLLVAPGIIAAMRRWNARESINASDGGSGLPEQGCENAGVDPRAAEGIMQTEALLLVAQLIYALFPLVFCAVILWAAVYFGHGEILALLILFLFASYLFGRWLTQRRAAGGFCMTTDQSHVAIRGILRITMFGLWELGLYYYVRTTQHDAALLLFGGGISIAILAVALADYLHVRSKLRSA